MSREIRRVGYESAEMGVLPRAGKPTVRTTRPALRSLLVAGALVVTATAVVPIHAAAQDAGAGGGQAGTVEQLSDQAMVKYQAGDFSGSIGLYLRAYQLEPSARLIYNIATIYDKKLGEKNLALDFYRRYVGAPDAEPELVQKVLPRIQALTASLEAPPVAPVTPGAGASAQLVDPNAGAPASGGGAASSRPADGGAGAPATAPGGNTVTAKQEPPTDIRPALSTTGWIVAGVGVVGLAVGATYGVLANQKKTSSEDYCDGSKCFDSKGVTLVNKARSYAKTADIGLIAGGVLAAAGAVLIVMPMLMSDPASSTPAISLTPTVGPDNVGLVLGGAW